MAQATPVSPAFELEGEGLSFATGGVGLLNLGDDTETISINIGGPVERAILYWAGRDRPCPQDASGNCLITSDPYLDQVLQFEGNTITGVIVGSEIQDGERNNIGYKADVTSIVQARGTGLQSFTIADANPDPTGDFLRLSGAGLLVIYTDPSDSTSYKVTVFEGMDFAFVNTGPPAARVTDPVTFTYDANGSDRSGNLAVFVGDAEPDRPDRIGISHSTGASLDILNALDASDGPEWDSDVFDITIPAGSDSTTVQLFSETNSDPAIGSNQPDSLMWEVGVLRIPVDSPANPAIDIEKSTNGVDADNPKGPFILVGDTVNWEYVVTNTGDVDLSSVVVTDDQGVSVSCPQDTLAVGESMTCTATGTAEPGQYANIGTVTGEDPDGTPVTDSDPSHYFGLNPDIDIEKTPDLQTVSSGSDVTFTIVVTNTGNVDLFNVTVTDVIAPDCDNMIGDLAMGASVSYFCTLEDVTADLTNVADVTGDDGNNNQVSDEDDADVVVVVPGGGEGCTPGFWKQEHHFDSWVGHSPSDDYETVFGVDASFTGTLLDALKQGGGGEVALGRHAVAALLNAATSDVSYKFTEADVIALVQDAYSTGDFEGAKNILEAENEEGCPLGNGDDDKDNECKKDWNGFNWFHKDDKDNDCDKDEDDKDNDCDKYDFDFKSFSFNRGEDCEDDDDDKDDKDDKDNDCDKDWNGFDRFNKDDDCKDRDDDDDKHQNGKDRHDDDRYGKDWDDDEDDKDRHDDEDGKDRHDDEDDRYGKDWDGDDD